MNHRIPLWPRFLHTVLAIVLSAQFWALTPLLVFLAGCLSPEIPESLDRASPNVYRRKICVVPPSLPPETKVIATNANRNQFVSDRDAEAYQKFLPQAETIFEYNVFAPPSSALLLGIGMRLSCPEQFEVLRPVDDVDEGESRIVSFVRIPTETHQELGSLVEQTCKTAAVDRLDKRYVGQSIGKRRPFFLGVANEEFQRRVRQLLGVEPIPEPVPSGPRTPFLPMRLALTVFLVACDTPVVVQGKDVTLHLFHVKRPCVRNPSSASTEDRRLEDRSNTKERITRRFVGRCDNQGTGNTTSGRMDEGAR